MSSANFNSTKHPAFKQVSQRFVIFQSNWAYRITQKLSIQSYLSQTVLLKPAKGKYTCFQLTNFLGLKLTTPNS